jgi:hypothetical protein
MEQPLKNCTIVLLIASVNLLSISITCFSPNYGSDRHQHNFFHLFESTSAHHAQSSTHPHAHEDAAEGHSHDCALQANDGLTIISAAIACDLSPGQEFLVIHSSQETEKLSNEQPVVLLKDLLSPPEKPPEFS